MRSLSALILLAALAAAEEPPVREDVVKKVRALLSTTKESERASLLAELKGMADLDWPSVRKGLQTGPYYQDPLATEYGDRSSGRHLGVSLTGEDKRERGFACYVPRSYKAGVKAPLLLFLHHDSYHANPGDRVGPAMAGFREACEKEAILFAAPATSQGAEWWTPEGRRLVAWTLARIKERYNVDEDRVALLGVVDGGSGCWALGQEIPDTFSCLMPMTGNPIDIAETFRPLYLGTLDRMDVLMGVAGKDNGNWGLPEYLAALKPMFDQGLRMTLAVFPRAAGDASYLSDV
ncbi:MAG: hypothetical protein ACREID_04320, partial [Planctomycetota bacterium]